MTPSGSAGGVRGSGGGAGLALGFALLFGCAGALERTPSDQDTARERRTGPLGSLRFTAAAAPDPDPHLPELGGLSPSAEAAARAFLGGLETGDASALEGLALSEAEFRHSVYPALPASRPERNTSARFLWELMEPRSRNSLATTLRRYGGRRLALVSVDFLGQVTDYGPFRVHRETVLTLRDEDGERTVARLFGSMVEQDGRFKIYSFVVD